MANVRVFSNTVNSVHQPPSLVLLLPDESTGWCEQYAQEGYNVIHIPYPPKPSCTLSDLLASASRHLPKESLRCGLITFGLLANDVATLVAFGHGRSNLRAFVHYNPLLEDGTSLLVTNTAGEYIP